MTRAFRGYALITAAGGLAALPLLGLAGDAVWDWRLLVIGAIVLLGELLPIDVPRREGLDRVTTSSAFALAALLLLGPLPAAVALAAASIVADGLVARMPFVKVAFNAAQYVLSLAAAAAAVSLTGAPLPLESLQDSLVQVSAGCAAFLVVNHVLAGIAAAMLSREPVGRYLVTDLTFQLITAVCVLALTPVILASAESTMAIVPLCLLPLLAIYFGARQATRDAHRAMHDALTGLPNRVLLRDRLERMLAQAGEPLVLMIVDLDDFKAVNDTLGHAYGDRLLQEVAGRLGGALRPSDTLARLGGDEFAVLLPGAGTGEGEMLATRLVGTLDQPFVLDGMVLNVRASVGFAVHPEHGSDPEDLLRRADIALYCAKSSQRPVEAYAPSQDNYSVDRLLLATQLRRGIEAGEIILEYQPKFPLAGGPATGVEALARWRHPDLGRVGPDGFVPLADQAGLMWPLTDVVLREALAQCRRWRDDGLELRMSVNLSPRSLSDPELPGRIAAMLDAERLEPEVLQLEITESRALPSGRGATRVADELRAMGVSIAIDDFGTGFSSLVQLQRLPVDEIKIDRSFVATMAHSQSDAAIVRSTIDLARNLGLRVTAEGVETEEARESLRAMGCELAQGYGLCRPVSADRCARVVRGTTFAVGSRA
ncbi:MAG TPA: EAL domain-containing protein [Solirubrobacteraceae bacterium]|nr:EAL domain-containing protein [Solirubrobacteraceae bacterium]